MKKRFFTFLMAVWALLSISQTVKAADFYLTGSSTLSTWVKLDGKSMTDLGGERYSQEYKCTNTAQYRFRIAGGNLGYELCPNTKSYNLLDAKPSYGCFANNVSGYADNYFYVDMESGKTYTFTFDNSNPSNRTVACTVSGEGSGTVTPIEKYCSFYLIGNLHSDSELQDGTRANLFTTFDGKTYTYTFTGVGKTVYFRVQGYDSDGNKFGADLAPDATENKSLTTNFETVVYKPYNSSPKAWYFDAKSDKTYTITLNYSDTSKPQIKYSEQGSGTVTKENPIANRKYSEGYYLVGNFFNFDGDNINYDDAVFKFQQQKDDAAGNAVYMVEIPATLTAKAQVMSVDATGTPVAVYGPGEVLAINNSTLPVGADNPTATTGIKDLKSNIKIEDGTNYWDMTTRRTNSEGVGQDGSYKYYITVDKTTGKPSQWEIKYTDLKRVAYFISTDKSASALTIGSIRVNSTSNFGSGKYFGSLYIDKGGEYYAISNDLRANEVIDKGYSYGYGAIKNQIDRPTYNKLFLFGNNGVDATTGTDDAKLAANKGTFKMPSITGVYVLEFNSNKGNNSVEGNYGGTGAEIINRSGMNVISSLSMVGPAIPGTTTGNEWDWASTVADMDFDVSENCYKLTIATTEENKNKEFRFVGDHTKKINWFENSNVDQSEKAAIYNNDGTYGTGHKASPSDPNEVSYTQNGLSAEDKSNDDNLNILWNRPAGTWTVRFYIYTYSQNGNDPSFRYFYTISENRDLELRDFEDVVYKSETRNILKRGGYRYFRTWSDNKAWKRPENVDVFVVSQTPAETSNGGFVLTKINRFNSSEDVIPANTGVILALRKDLEVPGAVFHTRKSLITYNTLVIPLEEATNKDLGYTSGDNHLLPLIEAQVVPTKKGKNYNYLFGFYRAKKVSDNPIYQDNDFLLGFWISNGTGAFYSNSAYLPIDEATAKKMNLGVSYNDFDLTTGAKKVPGVLFDFANVGGTTGINEVVNQSTKLNDGKYYTLSGQQVEKPTAGGIYIHNGRKFVVK